MSTRPAASGAMFAKPANLAIFAKLALLAVILLAAALRVAAMFDNFWLDEAWSLQIAQGCRSAADILFSKDNRVDNNHPLNTLWLYLAGDQPHWWVYRIPSVLAGVASVWLAVRVKRKRGIGPAIATGLLLAISYPLIVYSSEARGYALAVMFALTALNLIESDRTHWWRPTAYALCAVFGLLSHPIYVHFLLAAAVIDVIDRRYTLAQLLRWYAAPIAFAVAYFALFVARMHVAGGPSSAVAGVLLETFSLFAGGPDHGVLALIALAAIVAAAGFQLFRSTASRAQMWYVVIGLIALGTVLAKDVILHRGDILFLRYFLMLGVFFLLWLGQWLGAWLEQKGPRRIAASLILIAIAAGNLAHDLRFIRVGRGSYLDTFTYVVSESNDDVVTLGSDYDSRTQRLLSFYRRYLPAHPRITYIKGPTYTNPPEWYLWNTATEAARNGPPNPLIVDGKYVYLRDAALPQYGLSGWTWYIYRRAPSK